VEIKNKALQCKALQKSGGDRIRTGVQTYPPKAFYMLISALIVGNQQEPDKPTDSLAE
jgi:hypothetical protein